MIHRAVRCLACALLSDHNVDCAVHISVRTAPPPEMNYDWDAAFRQVVETIYFSSYKLFE